MCGSKVVKKIFGGGGSSSSSPAPAPTPATPVAAPTKDIETGVTSRRTRVKGKKKLTISAHNLGGGTGVNI